MKKLLLLLLFIPLVSFGQDKIKYKEKNKMIELKSLKKLSILLIVLQSISFSTLNAQNVHF